MKQTFKNKLKRIILWLVFGFVILFVFRFIYGYTKTIDDTPSQTQFLESINNTSRNYASKKYKVKQNNSNQSAIRVDQKYEKISVIKTMT